MAREEGAKLEQYFDKLYYGDNMTLEKVVRIFCNIPQIFEKYPEASINKKDFYDYFRACLCKKQNNRFLTRSTGFSDKVWNKEKCDSVIQTLKLRKEVQEYLKLQAEQCNHLIDEYCIGYEGTAFVFSVMMEHE